MTQYLLEEGDGHVQQGNRIVNLGVDREYIQDRVERPIIKHVLEVVLVDIII